MRQREIKFRAWDAANGVMIDDKFFIHQLTGLCFYTQSIPTYESDGGLGENVDELLDCGEEEPILMQFTGLLDKNRKESYFKDIVKATLRDIDGNYIGEYIRTIEFGEWEIELHTTDHKFPVA